MYLYVHTEVESNQQMAFYHAIHKLFSALIAVHEQQIVIEIQTRRISLVLNNFRSATFLLIRFYIMYILIHSKCLRYKSDLHKNPKLEAR